MSEPERATDTPSTPGTPPESAPSAGGAATATEGADAGAQGASASAGALPASPAAAAGATAEPMAARGQQVKKVKKGGGNKLPSPKRAKQEREEAAIKRVAGTAGEDGAAAPTAPSGRAKGLGALEATERVMHETERFTLWLKDHWQLLVAGLLVLVVITSVVGWRRSAARERDAAAFERLAEMDESGDRPAAEYEALLAEHAGTSAEPFIRLRIAHRVAAEGTADALARALDLYKAIERDADEGSPARALARAGAAGVERTRAFDPAKADVGDFGSAQVEGLAPLPAPGEAAPKPPAEPEKPDAPAAPAPAEPAAPAPAPGG